MGSSKRGQNSAAGRFWVVHENGFRRKIHQEVRGEFRMPVQEQRRRSGVGGACRKQCGRLENNFSGKTHKGQYVHGEDYSGKYPVRLGH